MSSRGSREKEAQTNGPVQARELRTQGSLCKERQSRTALSPRSRSVAAPVLRPRRVTCSLCGERTPVETLDWVGGEFNPDAFSNELGGTPGVIRTPDPLLRRQVLYPAELRAHVIDSDRLG